MRCRFFKEKLLTDHVNSVHLNLEFKCDQCDFAISTKRNFTKHTNRMHWELKSVVIEHLIDQASSKVHDEIDTDVIKLEEKLII